MILQKHDKWARPIWQTGTSKNMKIKLCIAIMMLLAALAPAQTNNLNSLLEQGLLEEQANRNLDAAITDYKQLATEFDNDRQLAATAVFRLGECYRAQGKTNEAAVEYHRVLRNFSDQTTLAILSRENLTGMGLEGSLANTNLPAPGQITLVGNSIEGDPTFSAEDEEIQRIQAMIQNSPDLINGPDSSGHTPLENAAINGQIKVAAFLLDHGADVNARGGTALFAATGAGNRAMVEFLLAHGADVNAINNSQQQTPLFMAVQKGFAAVTEVLLANKADVNARDSEGGTPLFSAAQRGDLKIIQMLLAAGANVNLQDNNGESVLNYTIKTSPEMVQALLAAGVNPNSENKDGRSPLSYATERDTPQVVKLLLDAKADPNAGRLDAPLLCAIHKQNAAAVEFLLQAGAYPNAKTMINWPVSFGGGYYPSGTKVTPMFLAALTKQLSLVQMLLKFKADPNDSQTDGRVPLFWVLDKPEIVKALLDAGADADARDKTEYFNQIRFGINTSVTPKPTLLQKAVQQNQPASVALLLQHGANPNASDTQGNTALHYAAFELVDEKVFLSLLDAKADPNVRNEDGKTPLDILKQALQNENWNGRFDNLFAKNAQAEKLIVLLHQHGALDNLPDWNRISVSRPANQFSTAVFLRGTNDWNQFTLLELLDQIEFHDPSPEISFPDLTRVVISRPTDNGAKFQKIAVNLLNGTNGVDCARDVPLKFGDVVEIPEREHSLAELPQFLTHEEETAILNHFRSQAGEAKMVVDGGETVQLPLQPFHSQIGSVLSGNLARTTLTSSSDLSQVKVTRRDPQTGKIQTWILDCSRLFHDGIAPDLWLRAGDVIEVPTSQ